MLACLWLFLVEVVRVDLGVQGKALRPYRHVAESRLGAEISRDVRSMRNRPWNGLKGFYMANELQNVVVASDLLGNSHSYWGIEKPASAFVEGALDDFWEDRGLSSIEAQQSLAVDTVVYLGLTPYQLSLLRQAAEVCPSNTTDVTTSLWNQSWSYYFGDGNSRDMLFGRANETAVQFFTENGTKPVGLNGEIKKLYAKGEKEILRGQCGKLASTIDRVRRTNSALLLQLIVRACRELFKRPTESARAGSWALAIALLPALHECDPSMARDVRRVFKPVRSSQTGLRPEEYVLAMEKLQSALNCFGLNCRDVGSFTGGHFCHMPRGRSEPSSRESDSISSKVGIVAIVFGVLALLLAPGFLFMVRAARTLKQGAIQEDEKKRKLPIIMPSELARGEGAEAATT